MSGWAISRQEKQQSFTYKEFNMITAEEIRLWNWVEYDGDYWQIDSINRHGSASLYREGSYSSEGVRITSCSPIPLTPEILEKNGISEAIAFGSENTYIKRIDDEYYLSCDFVTVSDKPIEYVHQLQNIYFALTGEELEIKMYEEILPK